MPKRQHHMLIQALKKRQVELKKEDNQYARIQASGKFTEELNAFALRDNRAYCIDMINKYHAIIKDLEDLG